MTKYDRTLEPPADPKEVEREITFEITFTGMVRKILPETDQDFDVDLDYRECIESLIDNCNWSETLTQKQRDGLIDGLFANVAKRPTVEEMT